METKANSQTLYYAMSLSIINDREVSVHCQLQGQFRGYELVPYELVPQRHSTQFMNQVKRQN